MKVERNIFVVPQQVVIPEPKMKESFEYDCADCESTANVMFQGTSYCSSCLHERRRRGTA